MRRMLSDVEVQRALAEIPGWARKGSALQRTVQFPTFMEGIAFVNAAAELAERENHHPDLDIRYSRVIITLSTHDSGGVTDLDIRMARLLDALLAP